MKPNKTKQGARGVKQHLRRRHLRPRRRQPATVKTLTYLFSRSPAVARFLTPLGHEHVAILASLHHQGLEADVQLTLQQVSALRVSLSAVLLYVVWHHDPGERLKHRWLTIRAGVLPQRPFLGMCSDIYI